LYKITNTTIGKKRVNNDPVEDENGMLVTGPKEKEVWANRLDQIPNRPSPDELISITEDPQIS